MKKPTTHWLLQPKTAAVVWKGIRFPTYEEVCGHSEYPLKGKKTYKETVRGYMRDKWPLPIFRCIAVDSPEAIDTTHVGTSWTYNADSAEPYYGKYGPGRGIYVLVAQVRPDQVNWLETIAMNMMPNDTECEVTVKEGEHIEILGIMDYKQSFEGYSDDDLKPFHAKMVTASQESGQPAITNPTAGIDEISSRFHQELIDYIDDVTPDWCDTEPAEWDAIIAAQRFELRRVSLDELESKPGRRDLDIDELDMSMAGRSRTEGPIILDNDLSVIDGMHRLTTAVRDGVKQLDAYVRIPGK